MTRARLPSGPRRIGVWIACWCVLTTAAGSIAADRDAEVITPRGSPIWLDPLRALLFDSPAVLMMAENQHSQPAAFALRVWIFDPDLRLKASLDYCGVERLDRRRRRSVYVPIEIPGVTLRDRAVITVARAASGETTWRLRESDAEQLAAARETARGSGGQLTFEREDGGTGAWECPCEPDTTAASCEARCVDSGPAAHRATRLLNAGCAASCICR